jgi:catechol 2,3-dioxygenase-like lactoylglutathione lyase family enzyme
VAAEQRRSRILETPQMFDHVTIRVSDRTISESFYDTVLTPLGIDISFSSNAFTVWHDFILTETSEGHPVTRGLHVAFAAPSREQVDQFWQAGTDAGYPEDGAPGPRPQYGPDYYGAFLRDPDGNSVEAVHNGTPRHRRDGIIDHLWIRVADLGAATAFYRIVAEAAAFDLRLESPERTQFSGRDQDGTFSLVRGHPTENLHMAFTGNDAAVHRFYDDLIAAGYRGNGEPGERPRYHPGYYAAFVLDPDGNNIEVVDHHRDD